MSLWLTQQVSPAAQRRSLTTTKQPGAKMAVRSCGEEMGGTRPRPAPAS